jgi:anti-sigma B factor antagonist
VSLFEVDITEGRLGPVAAVSGEVDLAAAEAVEERIRTTLSDEPDVLVLDLRAVDFLDSSGLRVVLSLDKAQRDRGARLVVVRGGRRVARVMELTGADRQLEMVDDPAEIQ